MAAREPWEHAMNDEIMKASISRFVKKVTTMTQGELDRAIRRAIASGKLQGHGPLTANVKLSSEKLDLEITLYSTIELM
jgi:hypothetical protein